MPANLSFFAKPKAPDSGDETPAEKAGRLFDAGLNCTQAVLQAVTGHDEPRLMQMAAPFGGGIGGQKCLCGALAGGVMALGLAGRGERAGELVQRFKAHHRATCCAALSGAYRWLSRKHLANCRRLTVGTAREAAELLEG